MIPNRKILIVTYYWPPSGGAGVQRWMNFTIQLQKKGWEPIVLTPYNPQFAIKDKKLLERVKELTVVKIPIWEPFNFFHKITGNKNRKNIQQGLVLEKGTKSFKDKIAIWIRGNLFIPDPRIFWIKPAASKALELIKKENIGTIITTGPPHSIHLIGRKIKRSIGIRWLADFRDPWSKWEMLQTLKTSSFTLKIHKKMEKSVLQESDIATTVSSRLAHSFGNIKVLHNGITSINKSSTTPNPSNFTIGYFGLLNDDKKSKQLWQLLDQMCKEDQIFANKLRIRIGGIVSESIKTEISELSRLKSKVVFLKYLSHDAVYDECKKCNLLLLFLGITDHSKWVIPIKFFEYLKAKRIILCLGDRKSDLGDLMDDKKVGEIIPYTEMNKIKLFIKDVFENKKVLNREDASILLKNFSHEHLVKKLEDIIHNG